MDRKWILGLVAVVAAGCAGFAASSVLGGESSAPDRPDYATVEIRAVTHGPAAGRPRAGAAARAGARSRASKPKPKPKKPRVVYLRGETTTVDITQTGPNIDIRLRKCPDKSRVIDGGVFPGDTNVFQQGSYVPNRKEYHVLLGFRDPALAQSFTLSSHLVCLKGVK
ncbi:MAG: hypothetical protein GEU88_01745 [Solirubrobacterales bacterium]|nr:hypothetical protein [Solirubrobacterales bacterium]